MNTDASNTSPSDSAVHPITTFKEESVETTKLSAVSAVAGSSASTQPPGPVPTEPGSKKKPRGMTFSAKVLELEAAAMVASSESSVDPQTQSDRRRLQSSIRVLQAWSAAVLAAKAKLAKARAARVVAVAGMELPLAVVTFAIRKQPDGVAFVRTHRKRDPIQTADAILDHVGEHAFGIDPDALARLQKAMAAVRKPVELQAAAKEALSEAKAAFRAAKDQLKAARKTLAASIAAHAVRVRQTHVASVAAPASMAARRQKKTS